MPSLRPIPLQSVMPATRLLVLLAVIVSMCTGHRFRRHRSDASVSEEEELVPNPNPMKTPPCDVLCDAQWKSDFFVTFQKSYELYYFEIPLDSIILGSKSNLNSFCAITQQKLTCYTRECDMKNIQWTPDKHICEDNLEEFRENHKCLSKTSAIVRRQCTDVCNNIPTRLSSQETLFLNSLRLPHHLAGTFMEQNQHCHFVACHQLCHEQVILHSCEEDERDKARHVVQKYFDAFLLKYWKDMVDIEQSKLYSSFCRRVTPQLDENAFVTNMTRFNNQMLERIKFEVKTMILAEKDKE